MAKDRYFAVCDRWILGSTVTLLFLLLSINRIHERAHPTNTLVRWQAWLTVTAIVRTDIVEVDLYDDLFFFCIDEFVRNPTE